MVSGDAELKHIWRHALIQLLDDYTSTVRHHGVSAGARMFETEPAHTGDPRIDAAFAALAEHLARRDGWSTPGWTSVENRTTQPWWFVTDLRGLHPQALLESPLSFRKRGVFITGTALERV